MHVRDLKGMLSSVSDRLSHFFHERIRSILVASGVFAVALLLVVPAAAGGAAISAEASDVAAGVVVPEDQLAILDEGTWASSHMCFPPLYLRVPNSGLLNNTMRADIFEHVTRNPGATFSEVREAVGAATGTVQHHLRVLVRGEVLRRVRVGKYTRYYPCNSRAVALSPPEEGVVGSLAADGPATKAELARRLGMSRQLVHYHVERMESKGLVEVDRTGRVPWVRLGSPEA